LGLQYPPGGFMADGESARSSDLPSQRTHTNYDLKSPGAQASFTPQHAAMRQQSAQYYAGAAPGVNPALMQAGGGAFGASVNGSTNTNYYAANSAGSVSPGLMSMSGVSLMPAPAVTPGAIGVALNGVGPSPVPSPGPGPSVTFGGAVMVDANGAVVSSPAQPHAHFVHPNSGMMLSPPPHIPNTVNATPPNPHASYLPTGPAPGPSAPYPYDQHQYAMSMGGAMPQGMGMGMNMNMGMGMAGTTAAAPVQPSAYPTTPILRHNNSSKDRPTSNSLPPTQQPQQQPQPQPQQPQQQPMPAVPLPTLLPPPSFTPSPALVPPSAVLGPPLALAAAPPLVPSQSLLPPAPLLVPPPMVTASSTGGDSTPNGSQSIGANGLVPSSVLQPPAASSAPASAASAEPRTSAVLNAAPRTMEAPAPASAAGGVRLADA
jgi:hypothetical protein